MVACEGQQAAMATSLLVNLTLFPLCICIQISESVLVLQAALSKALSSGALACCNAARLLQSITTKLWIKRQRIKKVP